MRYFLGKPLRRLKRIVFGIVISIIWAYVCAFYFYKSEFVQRLILLYRNTEPIYNIGAVLFLVTVLIACFVILGYDETKHSIKVDIISCIALCVVYIIICNFFIREGGLIYLVPNSAKYTTTEDFPVEKRANLESFLKFAELNNYKRIIFVNPKKQISYRDFLTMAAKSPSLLSSGYMKNHPKFYVRYLTNEILYPLSKDLAQKEYWERQLTVSSKCIEDYFSDLESTIGRLIFLARQYLSILGEIVNYNPEVIYKQWVKD